METKMTMVYWKSEKFWLGKLLEHPEIMSTLVGKAQEKALKKFPIEKMITSLQECYRRTIGQETQD